MENFISVVCEGRFNIPDKTYLYKCKKKSDKTLFQNVTLEEGFINEFLLLPVLPIINVSPILNQNYICPKQ